MAEWQNGQEPDWKGGRPYAGFWFHSEHGRLLSRLSNLLYALISRNLNGTEGHIASLPALSKFETFSALPKLMAQNYRSGFYIFEQSASLTGPIWNRTETKFSWSFWPRSELFVVQFLPPRLLGGQTELFPSYGMPPVKIMVQRWTDRGDGALQYDAQPLGQKYHVSGRW